MRPPLALALFAAGCGGAEPLEHYEATLGVPRFLAASGMEAGLNPPRVLPDASAFLVGEVIEVYSGELFGFRKAADKQVIRVRLAGATVPELPADAPAVLVDWVAKAKERLTLYRGRQCVVEAPPGSALQGGELRAHLIHKGTCVDAVLVAEGLALARPGGYPRFGQMNAAAAAAGQPPGPPPVFVRPPAEMPEPMPRPMPIPEPVPVPQPEPIPGF